MSVDLLKSQFWSYKDLIVYQNHHLQDIIYYAYNNISGYRDLWDKHKIKPDLVKTIKDLDLLPVVTRGMMQNIDKWTNKDMIKAKMRTGGSLSDPLTYYECVEGVDLRAQVHNRIWLWQGYDQKKDRRAIIASLRGNTGKKGLTLKISGNPDTMDIPKVLDQVKKFKPKQIRGYVSSLFIIAEWILKNGYEISVPSIDLISEQIYDDMRETIEKAFHATAFSEYVCCDSGAAGGSLDGTNNLYQAMERAVIRQDPETHKMRVTDMINKATVFINYENGDKVDWLDRKEHNKRNLLPFVVTGRENDILVRPDGTKISPSFLLHWGSHIKTSKGYIKFKSIQYIQDSRDNLRVDVVKDKGYDEEDEQVLIKTLGDICRGMSIKINYVEETIRTVSGKLKFIINNIKQ